MYPFPRCRPVPTRRALLVGAPLAFLARPAAAWTPDGPVRVLAGAAPGGVTDLIGRMVAEQLQKRTAQPVVVENPSGAAGNIAAAAVARARPDGRVLLIGYAALAINRLRGEPPGSLDPLQDLMPVARLVSSPATIMVHASSGIADFPALVARLRDGGPANWTAAAPGTVLQLVGEAVLARLEAHAEFIPYRGTGAVLPDFLAGRLTFVADSPTAYLPYLKDGTLRALAIAAGGRSSLLPSVPTLAELGLPGLEGSAWWGVLAPRGIAPGTAAEVARIATGAVMGPEAAARLAALGIEPDPGGPEEFAASIAAEMARWRPGVEALKRQQG